MFTSLLASLLLLSASVNAHGTITAVTGANGVNGAGFGIIASTPRNGATPKPFEQDTSVIRDNEVQSGKTGACGRTAAGGNNDVASQLQAASSAGLPSAAADGTVQMTVHQVNQDGAGPYTCDVSGDGGNTFTAATVTQNVPGKAGLSFAAAKDFQLTAQVPAGTSCTAGPNGDACLLRCRNNAAAGPFGSCVAITMGGAAGAAAPAAAAPAAAGAGAAAPAAAGAGAAAPAAAGAGAAAPAAAGAGTAGAGAAGAGAAKGAGAGAGAAKGAGAAGAAGGNQAAAGGAGGILGKLGLAKRLGAKGAAKAAKAAKGAKGAAAKGAAAKGAAAKGAAAKGAAAEGAAGAAAVKRLINSRVAGANSGYWIEA